MVDHRGERHVRPRPGPRRTHKPLPHQPPRARPPLVREVDSGRDCLSGHKSSDAREAHLHPSVQPRPEERERGVCSLMRGQRTAWTQAGYASKGSSLVGRGSPGSSDYRHEGRRVGVQSNITGPCSNSACLPLTCVQTVQPASRGLLTLCNDIFRDWRAPVEVAGGARCRRQGGRAGKRGPLLSTLEAGMPPLQQGCAGASMHQQVDETRPYPPDEPFNITLSHRVARARWLETFPTYTLPSQKRH